MVSGFHMANMAQSHTGDGAIDEQLTTLPGLGEADEDDVEALVDALTDHGPEDSAVVMSEGQAEALVRRKFVGQSRQETAEAMDCSVWTVDGNLTRAKANLETVDEAALAFDATGAFNLRRVDIVGSHSVDEDDQEASEDVAAWGRVMAVETVVEVVRPETSTFASVRLSAEADEADLEAVEADLETAGYVVRGVEGDLDSGATVRAWEPGTGPLDVGDDGDDESDESGAETDDGDEADESPIEPGERREVLLLGGEPVPSTTDGLADDLLGEIAADVQQTLEVDLEGVEDGEVLGAVEFDGNSFAFDPADDVGGARTCHYCGGPFDVDEDDPGLLVDINNDPDERPVCGSCLSDVAMGDELEPLPEFVDEDDQEDDGDESDESGVESEDVDEADATPGDDDEDDESDVYRCECGAEFDSAGALGGHSRYCDVGDETEGSA